MSLSLPPDSRRAWIIDRLDPLETEPPDAAKLGLWYEEAPKRSSLEVKSPTLAAVLLTLVERPEGLGVLLTTRPDTMRNHAGQIALPGGRSEPGETPADTALREAEEEIGLPRDMVTLAGLSTPCLTGTGFLIIPVVGFAPPDPPLTANPHEVVDIFETPLEFLLDPANHEEHWRETATGEKLRFHSMTWENRFIWGATAAILRRFHERLFGVTL